MKNLILILVAFLLLFICISFKGILSSNSYQNIYKQKIIAFSTIQNQALNFLSKYKKIDSSNIEHIKSNLEKSRMEMKKVDFWLRYMEPLAYKKINSPLPVEWETEVFEKFEKPYQRIGAGLTLARIYLDEENPSIDTLNKLLKESASATEIFLQDSIQNKMKTFDHFYFCNRLFLLNLASIYTTGFECPDTNQIVPELRIMLNSVSEIYTNYNESFPEQKLNEEYIKLYHAAIKFTSLESDKYSHFNHYEWIKNYVNPLFQINQKLISTYAASSRSNLDFSLNKTAISIFDKNLYSGQNTKGIFLRVKDENDLQLINDLGKMLFYDPILSSNNQRSCASCHNPKEFFTDTLRKTSLQLNKIDFLDRNSPSLLNAPFQHLAMLDGKFTTLQHQGKGVITNPIEMGSIEKEVVEKVLSCKEYKNGFSRLLKYTPQEKEISLEHIVSAISFYYGKFSQFESPFDKAINKQKEIDKEVIAGFNLYMSKSQCATCHFVPQFNGVKPPYIGSEFEVLGTPADPKYTQLSKDKGRYLIHEAPQTAHAFRTSTLRNVEKTKPYMHNGVFNSLEDVVEFYNGGGGVGRGFKLENQTLSSDSLHLSAIEKKQLISFMKSLTEDVVFEHKPEKLPQSKNPVLNSRKVGGEY